MNILDPPMDPTDDMPLDFGKHRGKTPRQLVDLEPSYVVWLHETIPSVVSRSAYLDACFILDEDQDRRYIEDETGEEYMRGDTP